MHRSRLVVLAPMVAAQALAPSLAGGRTAVPRPAPIAQAHQPSVAAVPKFVFHAGLAFGALQHFIDLPVKAGKFASGSPFSKLKHRALVAGAAVFVDHETELAPQAAQQNNVLTALVSPLAAVVDVSNTIVSKIKGCSLDASTVTSAPNEVTTIESQAKSGGSPIAEAIPSAKPILTGSA